MKAPDSPIPPFSHSPTHKLGRLLIVDDEPELMTTLCTTLAERGYETVGFSSGHEALEVLKEQEFDVLLTDLMMPEMDGITLLRAALDPDPNLVGIVMTGHGTVQTAVDAMKVGAFDYVLKPFKLNTLLPVIARALDVRRLRLENLQLRETTAIYELSMAVALTLDMNTILHKGADAAMQGCKADEVSIMLPMRAGTELYVAITRGENREHLLGYHMSIGQGALLVTPMQVARFMSAVANGGVLWKPRLVQRIERPEQGVVFRDPGQVNGHVELSPVVWALIRDGLWAVVNEWGTGGAAKIPGLDVAGKTGTAQTMANSKSERGEDHAWFAAFAPVRDPQAVVVVLVERGGHGGEAAAPIARKIFNAIFYEKVAMAGFPG